ncbi:MAG: hypothetical protein V4649_07385 [Bacteroidota bacterium]
MKHLLTACLGLAALTTFYSCSVERDIVLNSADKVCSPGLRERGELVIDGSRKMKSTGYGGTSASWSGDVAYAVKDHIGLFASVRTLDEHYESRPKGYAPGAQIKKFNLTGMRTDVAIGYFTGFGAHGKLETYYGLGFGSIDHKGAYPVNYNVDYLRAFGQFGAGYDGNILSLMGGVKLSGQSNANLDKVDITLRDAIKHKDGKYDVLLLDPYVEAQLGYKLLKLSMQVGCNNVIPYDMNTSEQNRYYLSGFYFTMGLTVRFAHRHSEKRQWGAKKYWEMP